MSGSISWTGGFSGSGGAKPLKKGGFKFPAGKGKYNSLLDSILAGVPQPKSLQEMILSGVESPLMSSILEPALARLIGEEDTSRQNLADQFRAAGGLRSGAYGNSAVNLESELQGRRGDLVSDVLSKTLGTLVPGMLQEQRNAFLPTQSLTDILKIISPTYRDPIYQTWGSGLSGMRSGSGRGGSINMGPSQIPSIFDPVSFNPSVTQYGGTMGDWTQSMYAPSSPSYYSPDISGYDWSNTPDYGGQEDYSGWY